MSSDRDRHLIELGVSLGIACSAGLAGECPEMSARQIAAMLDAFASDDHAVRSVAHVAAEHALLGREITPADFRDAIATLLRSAKGTGHG